MSKNATYAKEYMHVIDKTKELIEALDNIECTDKNDLFELIQCKIKLESWYKIEELDEDLKSDMYRLKGYIEDKIRELQTDDIEKIKTNSLKIRYNQHNKSYNNYSIMDYIKYKIPNLIVISMITLLTITGKLNRVTHIICDLVATILESITETEIRTLDNWKTFSSNTEPILMLLIILILYIAILKLIIDAAYILMPHLRELKLSILVSEHVRKMVELNSVSTLSKTEDLVDKAKWYLSELNEYADRLANSNISINDKHHRKTFKDFRDSLVNNLKAINIKVQSEIYTEQLEGLAQAEMMYKEMKV